LEREREKDEVSYGKKWMRVDSGNIAEFGQRWLLEAKNCRFPLTYPDLNSTTGPIGL
jgi:hypothetical protein